MEEDKDEMLKPEENDDDEESDGEGGEKLTTDLVGDDASDRRVRAAESWFSQVREGPPIKW